MKIDALLIERTRGYLASWKVEPVAKHLYRSAARGDGSVDSDIDIWLIRTELNPTLHEMWQDQAFRLSIEIQDWTGSRASVLESSIEDLPMMVANQAPILIELKRDAVALSALTLDQLPRSAR